MCLTGRCVSTQQVGGMSQCDFGEESVLGLVGWSYNRWGGPTCHINEFGFYSGDSGDP